MTDHDRDEERLRRLLHTGPIQPLAPDAGNFDRIVTRARRRKQRQIFTVLGAFVLVAALGLGVGVLTGHAPDRLSQRPANPSTQTASASASGRPSGSPSASPSTSPTAQAGGQTGTGLPAGGPVPAGFRVSSVTSVGNGVSYALGTAPCSSSICTSMVRTTDSGKTWVGIRPPKVSLAKAGAFPSGSVGQVRFASPTDGWLYGGSLYATHNGGASWQQLHIGAGVVRDLATDGSTAYAVVSSCSSAGACTSGRLYSAPVGSNSWTAVSGVAQDQPDSQVTAELSLGETGVLALGNVVYVRDGSSWRQAATVPCAADAGLSDVAASAADSTVLAFCGGGGAGQLYLSTYASTDGGHSWHARSPDGVYAQVSNGAVTAAASSSKVLLVGSDSPDTGSAVQRSTDGGASWSDATLPASANGWAYVGASGGGRLVAISAAGTLYVSTDNGASWAAVSIKR